MRVSLLSLAALALTVSAPAATGVRQVRRPVSSPASLRAAAIAVLGTAAVKRERLDGDDYETRAERLFETSFGPVLATLSTLTDDCEPCQGAFGVGYLSRSGGGFSLKRRWPLVLRDGTHGNPPYEVRIEPRFTDSTALAVRSGYALQGYECDWITLVELRPAGPVDRGTIYLSYDDSGTGYRPVHHRVGHITNIRRGHGFDVVVPGTRIREHYRMIRGSFVGPETSKLHC